MTSGYKAQVVLKQFWDINSKTQVGTCKLCPQTKQSTVKPEYRMVQSGSKKAYPNWTNMGRHTCSLHFKEYDKALKMQEVRKFLVKWINL